MDDLLRELIEQNRFIADKLDIIADKLDLLESIEEKICKIADNVDEDSPASMASSVIGKLAEICNELQWNDDLSAIGQILNELSWHKENTTADRMLRAIESLEEAIRDLKS